MPKIPYMTKTIPFPTFSLPENTVLYAIAPKSLNQIKIIYGQKHSSSTGQADKYVIKLGFVGSC